MARNAFICDLRLGYSLGFDTSGGLWSTTASLGSRSDRDSRLQHWVVDLAGVSVICTSDAIARINYCCCSFPLSTRVRAAQPLSRSLPGCSLWHRYNLSQSSLVKLLTFISPDQYLFSLQCQLACFHRKYRFLLPVGRYSRILVRSKLLPHSPRST